jgi:multiple sugar transport system permease protein
VTTATVERTAPVAEKRKLRIRPGRILMHVFLTGTALSFLAPLLWTFYTSLRPYADTAERGYVSLPGTLNFDNYTNAWSQADLPLYYLNTLIITVPAVIITLLLASFVAFGISRFSWRGNIALLILFTAGNLLPQQIVLTPLYRLYLELPLPYWMSDSEVMFDSYWGVIAIHVAFQIGFCTFVLSNYMKTLPVELTEAAIVDGASVWRQYWQVIMPLCKPAVAALATLEFTWIYNDFLWALVLMQTGEKRPIVAGLSNLQGVFFKDNNLIAAGAMLAALPTLIIYFALQRHFIGGLTLGGTKG